MPLGMSLPKHHLQRVFNLCHRSRQRSSKAPQNVTLAPRRGVRIRYNRTHENAGGTKRKLSSLHRITPEYKMIRQLNKLFGRSINNSTTCARQPLKPNSTEQRMEFTMFKTAFDAMWESIMDGIKSILQIYTSKTSSLWAWIGISSLMRQDNRANVLRWPIWCMRLRRCFGKRCYLVRESKLFVKDKADVSRGVLASFKWRVVYFG